MQIKLTPEQFEYLFDQLTHNGMTNEPSHFSTNFTTQGHGITATIDYDTEAEEAAVTINHKPFYVSEAHIQDGIEAVINSMPLPETEGTEKA